MARVAQEIPKVGLVMEAVKVVRWLKNVGDVVTQGEPIVEVETEKSIVEIEAAVSGRLAEILAPPETEAKVGDPIAWLESDSAPAAAPKAAPATAPTPPKRAEPASRSVVRQDKPASGRLIISPAARRWAADHRVPMAGLAGSGPRGRVQLADVKRAAESPMKGTSRPLSPMRRALARAMTLSNATVPQFIVERSVDWTVIEGLRATFATKLGPDAPKLSVNDFLMQALAQALLDIPAMNATFAGDADSPDARLIEADGAHIGLVVAVDGGLLVPVIHHADRLGLTEIARRRTELVASSFKGRLKREDLEGATLSLSNLGAQGPDRFTAIINPPQSAILAVGRQRDVVIARDGSFVVRPQSTLALTVDHRVADGKLASDFLARVTSVLEARDWRP